MTNSFPISPSFQFKNRFAALMVVPIVFGCVVLAGAENGEPESAAKLLDRAETAASQGESRMAVDLASQAIQRDATLADAYYLRGREFFRLGEINKSVADFDKLIELRPALASRQWERGIALYFAGRFEDGAKQFELYQTFHDNDVENSVWKYMCVARKDGVEAARKTMLPIKNDPRVPMMDVYKMFRGEVTPDDVLAAAKADSPSPEVLAGRLFYAQLYIGLFHEAAGEKELAKKFILQAADDHKNTARVNRYMWDVARIHADLLCGEMPAKP